jgi:ketosteroid isomerase-like protein
MSREHVDAIRHGFELWNVALSDPSPTRRKEAIEAMMAAYHPEAEIDFARTTPDYRAEKGPGAMLAWMQEADGLFDQVQIEAVELIDAGDTVVVAARMAGTGASSGATVEIEYAYVFRFKDGQVIAATSYATLEQAREATGLTE